MKQDYLYDPHANKAADDIITLLNLCQQLQSEKDGKERPVPEVYSRDEDEFAERIRAACGYGLQLRQLLPMMSIMSAIGAEMECRGEISIMTGESYSNRALTHLMAEYLPGYGDAP
ncbi:hypothetical protein [Enterobacter cancerogenus]